MKKEIGRRPRLSWNNLNNQIDEIYKEILYEGNFNDLVNKEINENNLSNLIDNIKKNI